jgi:hypothetical protein
MINYNLLRNNIWHGIGALSAILLILILTTLLQAYYTWRSINEENRNRRQMEVNVMNEKIDNLKSSVATIVGNSAPVFEQNANDTKQVEQLLFSMVRQNPELLGAAVAFVPGYHPERGQLYAPYVFRQDSIIKKKLLKYDYTLYDWYTEPVENKEAGWCEPYTDGDGTYLAMTTYSFPLRDGDGNIIAVLTGDLPMSELSYLTFNIYHETSRRGIIILCMQIFTMLLILFVGWWAIVSLRKYNKVNKENEEISNEMSIASTLQAKILPREYPKDSRVALSASLVNAPQVSGDFYDFAMQGDFLYFCIGDVATNGLGAALAMTVTRTVYRTSMQHHEPLSRMVSNMNQALVGISEQHMYATFFAGRLDLATGLLCYCNAGHLAPFLLSGGDAKRLEVESNVPLGFTEWEFTGQQVQMHAGDVLFLFTDGIVEAMNPQKEVFGDKRLALHMKRACENGDSPEAVVKRIGTALKHHLGVDNPNKDDLTMLALSYVK